MESPKLEYIQSKDNRTIKRAMSLKQRKQRQKLGEYLVEGLRLVCDIAKNGVLRVLLVKESKCDAADIQALIELAVTKGISTYIVQDPLFAKLEDTQHSQGIIGIAEKPMHMLSHMEFTDGLYIAIDGVQDPGNLGTIIRTAVASGVRAVFLLKGTVDVYNEKCVRSTMSALHHIPIFEDVGISEFYDVVKENDITTYVTTLDNAMPYDEVQYSYKSMIIVGNEGNGVSSDILQLADQGITIPMYGNIESLNVSVAAALCMYKVREQLPLDCNTIYKSKCSI